MENNCEFLILSGKYGLLSPETPIPYYDFLLQNENVETMTSLLTEQLGSLSEPKILFFTGDWKTEPKLRPYFETLNGACSALAIPLKTEII